MTVIVKTNRKLDKYDKKSEGYKQLKYEYQLLQSQYKYNKYLEDRLSSLAEADINGNRYVTGLTEDNYVWYSENL